METTYVICISICFALFTFTLLYKNHVDDKRYEIMLNYFEQRSITLKATQVIQLLQEDFPKLFVKKPKPKKALKIGIYNDLIMWATENHFELNHLEYALHLWTTGKRYRTALATGKRYDLDGKEVVNVENS